MEWDEERRRIEVVKGESVERGDERARTPAPWRRRGRNMVGVRVGDLRWMGGEVLMEERDEA